MNQKYIVIEQTQGVFLGNYGNFALFAKNDPVGLSKAFCFKTETEAKLYVSERLPSIANTTIYAPVDCADTYATVVDIIKAGYSEYTHHMMDNMPMLSESYH